MGLIYLLLSKYRKRWLIWHFRALFAMWPMTKFFILPTTSYKLRTGHHLSPWGGEGDGGLFGGDRIVGGTGGGYQSSLTECKGELLEIDFQRTAHEEGGGGCVVRIIQSLLSLCGDQENFILTPTNSSPVGDKSWSMFNISESHNAFS